MSKCEFTRRTFIEAGACAVALGAVDTRTLVDALVSRAELSLYEATWVDDRGRFVKWTYHVLAAEEKPRPIAYKGGELTLRYLFIYRALHPDIQAQMYELWETMPGLRGSDWPVFVGQALIQQTTAYQRRPTA